MIGNLKSYKAMKDSGLPWLGAVPSHWETRRMKVLFEERSIKGHPKEPLLAATQSMGVVRKVDYGMRTVVATNGLENLKLVEVGDFVISLRSFQGGIEMAHARGIISPAYTVLRPRNGFEPKYFRWYFKSPTFIDSMTLFVTGIREGQNIDYVRLSRAFMPLPPPSEQAAIVKYLNWATGRIDRAIRAKKKIIALLNEQKQAIIHQAVTRGLDPNVRMKPSGIPWLGEIPEHWEVRRLGYAIRLQTGYPFASSGFVHGEEGVRLLRGVNVTPTEIRWKDSVRWHRSEDDGLDDFALEAGDIVLGMDRPIIEAGVRACIVREEDTPSLLLQRVARLQPSNVLDAKFLLLLLRGIPFRDYIAPIFTGISVPHLSPQQIRNFRVALPSLKEQRQIVSHLDIETSGLVGTASKLEREIDLLREFQTRLVSDVVTGKTDVRESAAALPDLDGATLSDVIDLDQDIDYSEMED